MVTLGYKATSTLTCSRRDAREREIGGFFLETRDAALLDREIDAAEDPFGHVATAAPARWPSSTGNSWRGCWSTRIVLTRVWSM
jgi:hypothetical protein